ncbi:NADP-dependent isocitrate dehydrogenase [Campylobacter sputorum]|uniref:NADP-dependent isocitrate dehydrogenase n=1 Tax=Campylobacter sputorum TaxID=206 RepID=UPI00053BE594|nr:NADP-dependent isocitrate dehydrogenase [Campylobacter sputorum]
MSDIVYTYTDEAPAMATFSLYPIIKKFLNEADISISLADISLAGRIMANFSQDLRPDQGIPDYLEILGDSTNDKFANIIKLPNISASIPQLNAAIDELRKKGINVPLYPTNPKNDNEKEINEIYAKVLGSAVNPVLRQGNSDRRSVKAVKDYAKEFPHKVGSWDKSSKTCVRYMNDGDFYSNEKSRLFDEITKLKVEFISKNGEKSILKQNLSIQKNEIVDATFMSVNKLEDFLQKCIDEAKKNNIIFSIHLKATMMKISDPVIFGHAVRVYFKELFNEFKDEISELKFNEQDGLKDLENKLENSNLKDKIKSKLIQIYNNNPRIAMVDSNKGITNLHVPSDIIVDASMAAMIRNGGKMWDKDGKVDDCMAVIPDKTYATLYESVIENLKEHGKLDPAKIGSVSNIGLMAKKAEEYGSHDKTFIMQNDGTIIVSDDKNREIFKFEVCKGDIFRMCQAKDDAIKNWVELAVNRAKITKSKTIFWLDEKRAHDNIMINQVKKYLKELDTNGLDLEILAPQDAAKLTLETIRKGKDVISVTGNVLRDYLTDLFPILELGTSAKMLSVVPLLQGGGMFETGAGGSAPKIAEQLIKENHLRWDSLGEFLALSASLDHLYRVKNINNALILSNTLEEAISMLLKNDRSPKKNVGELDNRGSHFYLALYWALSLAKNGKELSCKFKNIAKSLQDNEEKILDELSKVQGNSVDVGGYYKFDDEKMSEIMRPSKTLNDIINK